MADHPSDGNLVPNADNHPGGNETAVLTIIWATFLVAFLIAPCCVVKRRRNTCLRRLQERRWHVEIEEETEEQWFIAALERYQAAEARNGIARPTEDKQQREEEEKERQLVIQKILGRFTTTLRTEDIVEEEHYDILKGELNKADLKTDIFSNDTVACATNREGESEECEDPDVEIGTVKSPKGAVSVVKDGTSGALEYGSSASEDMSSLQSFSAVQKVVVPLPGVAIYHGDPVHKPNVNGTTDVPSEEKVVTELRHCVGDDINRRREVTNGCAICLESFTEGDRLCWSSNNLCPHVFHEECIVSWLMALGRRKRRQHDSHVEESGGIDRKKDLADFPMLCPCCRQDFAVKSGGAPNAAVVEGNAEN